MSTASHRPRTRIEKRNQPFRLLDLPPELRNTIYEYAFQGSTTTVKKKSGAQKKMVFKYIDANGRWSTGLPGILGSKKQVRDEALGIFYAETKFTVHRIRDLYALLRKLGEIQRMYYSKVINDRLPFSKGRAEAVAAWVWEALIELFGYDDLVNIGWKLSVGIRSPAGAEHWVGYGYDGEES